MKIVFSILIMLNEKNKHIKGLEAKNEKLRKQIYELNYKLSKYERTGL